MKQSVTQNSQVSSGLSVSKEYKFLEENNFPDKNIEKIEHDALNESQDINMGVQKQSAQIKKRMMPWTQEKFKSLFETYAMYGSSWKQIGQKIGINNKQVKNKFYSTVRRLTRKIDNIGKKQMKTRKTINFNSILRTLQACIFENQPYQGYNYDREWIRSKVLEYCKNSQQILQADKAEQLMDRIHQFNFRTKSRNLNQQSNHNSLKINILRGEHEALRYDNKGKQKTQNNLINNTSRLQEQVGTNTLNQEDNESTIEAIQDLKLEDVFSMLQLLVQNKIDDTNSSIYTWQFHYKTNRSKRSDRK